MLIQARPLLNRALNDGNYDELVDSRLENAYSSVEMARLIACAAASVRHSARRRPKMSQARLNPSISLSLHHISSIHPCIHLVSYILPSIHQCMHSSYLMLPFITHSCIHPSCLIYSRIHACVCRISSIHPFMHASIFISFIHPSMHASSLSHPSPHPCMRHLNSCIHPSVHLSYFVLPFIH